jgi:hypothetical protein
MFRHRCSCSFLSSAAAHSGARSRLSQSCCQRFSIWSSPPSGVPVSPVRCRCQVLIFFGAVIQKSALQRALAPVLLRHSLLGFSSVLFSRAAVPGHFLRRGRWGVSGSCQLPPALRVLAGHDFPVVAFSFSLPLASGFDAGNFVRFLWRSVQLVSFAVLSVIDACLIDFRRQFLLMLLVDCRRLKSVFS